MELKAKRELQKYRNSIIEDARECGYFPWLDDVNEALAELEQLEAKSCEWVEQQDPVMDTYYDTQCGQSQYFGDGGIADNHYKFCPYCGGKIQLKPKDRE